MIDQNNPEIEAECRKFGYHLAASFENLHYGEVWTYLYALLLLVFAADWWSGRLRREVLR